MTDLYEFLSSIPEVAAVTVYTTQSVALSTNSNKFPLMLHTTTTTLTTPQPTTTIHVYPSVPSLKFILPNDKDYAAGPASLAHTRTLQFLKQHLNGPFFNLEAIWDEHCGYEFGERSVENTMATMVDEPYVNHVPTVCLFSFVSALPRPDYSTELTASLPRLI